MGDNRDLEKLERQLAAPGLSPAGAGEEPAAIEALKRYLETGDEEQAFRRLDRLGMLEEEDAAELLLSALSRSADLFQKLLGHCPKGEYAGSAVLECWRKSWGKKARYEIQVEGTLLTLAAAMDLPEHIRLLLEAGYDPNSASLSSAAAIRRQCRVPDDMVERLHRGVLCGCLGSKFGHRDDELDTMDVWGRADYICEATPLAAAVYLGNVDSVKELLKWEGVWRCECRPVSMVLALPWRRGDKAYEKACELVRRDDSGAIRPLDLASVAWFCAPEMLEWELANCPYGTRDLQMAALELLDPYSPIRDAATPLRALCQKDPGALRGEEVRGLLALKSIKEQGNSALWALLEEAAGEELNLSYVTPNLLDLDWKVMASGLRRLSDRFRLTLSRDVVCRSATARQLRALMQYVTFLPPDSETGVSGLTQALIGTKSVPLVKKALDQNLLPGNEPLVDLLPLTGHNPALRALLITAQRERQETVAHNWELYDCRSFSPRELEGEESHVERLRHEQSSRYEMESFPIDSPLGHTLVGGYSAFCFLERDWEVLTRMADARAILCVSTEAFYIKGGPLESACWMTPLCCAALGGQTATVRRLLELGYDPDERDIGMPSHMKLRGEPISPITPLLAALLCGRRDTAELLLEHGAVCDLTERSVLRLWAKVRGAEPRLRAFFPRKKGAVRPHFQ